MECPHCGLLNPPTALRCDCGYDFSSGRLERSSVAGEIDTAPAIGRELRTFVPVPFIATAVWYVVMLAYLAGVNGRLRLRTDILAFALGAVILGLPVAVAATVLLAIPAYLLVRHTVGVNLTTAAVGGGLAGLAAALAFWMVAREWSVLSPLRGIVVGVTTAIAWWHLAGRPQHRKGQAA